MLQGVVPFPAEFARRYRERGYWTDKSLAQEFKVVFERYADRVAVIDRERAITYAELNQLSDNLALNLLYSGIEPLDRVVVQLPNVAEFVILYFAVQKIGCIPIAALASHRYREISQFVALSGATACVVPDRHGDFDYAEMIERIRERKPEFEARNYSGSAHQRADVSFKNDWHACSPSGFGALEDIHRPGRSSDFSTFGWHHRCSETDSAHQQRLCVQFEGRRSRLRCKRRVRPARGAADRT